MSSNIFGSGFNASSTQDDPFTRMGQEFRALRRKVFDLEFKLSDLQHQMDLRDAPGYRGPSAGTERPTVLPFGGLRSTDSSGDVARIFPGPPSGGMDRATYLGARAEMGSNGAGLKGQTRRSQLSSGTVLPGLNITTARGLQFYRPGLKNDSQGSQPPSENSSEAENPTTPDLEAEDAEREDLREQILPQVREIDPEADAERITEMIFELDLDDIRPLVTDPRELKHRIEEATRVAVRTGHPRSWAT